MQTRQHREGISAGFRGWLRTNERCCLFRFRGGEIGRFRGSEHGVLGRPLRYNDKVRSAPGLPGQFCALRGGIAAERWLISPETATSSPTAWPTPSSPGTNRPISGSVSSRPKHRPSGLPSASFRPEAASSLRCLPAGVPPSLPGCIVFGVEFLPTGLALPARKLGALEQHVRIFTS